MPKNTQLDAIASQLGAPATSETTGGRKPQRNTFLQTSCGDLSIYFGSIAWPEADGSYPAPSPQFYARVRGFNKASGFAQDVPLSDDPEKLEKMAEAFRAMADFVRQSQMSLSVDRDVDNMSEAAKVFGIKKA